MIVHWVAAYDFLNLFKDISELWHPRVALTPGEGGLTK